MATRASERSRQGPSAGASTLLPGGGEAPPQVLGEPQPAAGEPQQPAVKGRPRLIGVGELTSATAALALLALLFALKWYGVAGVPDPSAARPAISTAINGWHGLPIVRWAILLTIVVAVGSALLHISQRRHGSKTETSRLITALGAVISILLIYRVLIALPSSDRVIDQKLGAVLGLACALIITVGGRQSMLEQRSPETAAASRARRPRGRVRRR